MREEIIRATAKIISTDGLESASTRAICDAVGITAPTLYYYFKRKPDLIDEVTKFAIEIHRKNKRKALTSDPIRNLQVYWDVYMHFYSSEPELHRAMILSISQGRMTEAGLSCFSDLVGEFKKLEARGDLKHSALQCAQMYLGAAQGISMILMSLPPQKLQPSLSASTRDVVLSGLIKL